jgi:hypothetical protein
MLKKSFFISLIVIGCLTFSFAEDESRLKISLGAERVKLPVHFVVTNPQGQREGQTSDNSVYIGEQSHTSYSMESLPGIPYRIAEKSLQYDSRIVPAGIHTMTVYGIDTSTYSFEIRSRDSAWNKTSPNPLGQLDIILAGKTAQYKINYDPTPGGKKTTFEKVVTYETLHQDLQAAKELKAIKSDAVFNQFLQKIEEMERNEKIGGIWKPVEDRREFLETLAKEIKAQPKKIMHPQISAILQQDINILVKNLE